MIGNMIQVDRLSRRFGSFKAVDGISFEVGKGEIVGLLGPNGAGKTTTMRMLTTFLTPTSGRAYLAGFDVLDSRWRSGVGSGICRRMSPCTSRCE